MVSAERGQVTGDDESKQNQKRLTPFPETLARRTPSRSLPGVGVVDVNVGSGGGSDDDDGGDDVNGGGNNSLDGFPVPNSSGDKTRKLSAGPLIPETCTWSWSCIRSCTPIMALDTSPPSQHRNCCLMLSLLLLLMTTTKHHPTSIHSPFQSTIRPQDTGRFHNYTH